MMDLWLDTGQDERLAVKTAVALSISRYRDTIGKFVQGKPERLDIVSEQLARIACECAEASKADEEEVEAKFRAFLADEVAVTEPEKQNVTDNAEYNNSDEVPQPERGVRDDIKSGDPVLYDSQAEHLEMDADSTLESDSYISNTKEALGGPVTCPQCGHPMTQLQNPQAPGAATQQQCPNCGATFTPGQAGTQPTVPQPTGIGGGMYAKCARCEKESAEENSILCEACNHFVITGKEYRYKCNDCGESFTADEDEVDDCPKCGGTVSEVGEKKEAQGDLEDPDSPVEENVQSPAEEDPTNSQQNLPPAAKEDSNGPAEVYTGVVQQTANADAASAWSTPGDQDIQQISEQYGIDPDTVRKELRIVADFGDSLAVNGDPNADPNVDGLVELQDFGGRIPTTEQEVDVDNALQHTSDQTGLSPEDVYALVKESYGGDIGGQHYVSVSGEAHYYLPQELVGNQQPQQPDIDAPTETPQEAIQSSVPAHFQSLTAFLEWEKAQQVSA